MEHYTTRSARIGEANVFNPQGFPISAADARLVHSLVPLFHPTLDISGPVEVEVETVIAGNDNEEVEQVVAVAAPDVVARVATNLM